MTDKRKYMDDLRKQLTSNAQAEEAYRKTFMTTSDENELRDALSNLSVLTDKDTIKKATGILKDEKADAGLRVLALYKLTHAVALDKNLILYVLRLLKNKNLSADLRKAAFNCIQTVRFSSPVIAGLQTQITDAFKSLVEDKNQKIRESVITYLAQQKDEFVQRKLLEGITEPAKALLPEEKAVHLLGYDIHAGIYPTLRSIVEKSSNNYSRMEAIHILGSEPDARDLLLKVYNNKKERFGVRKNSLMALKMYHPEEFNTVAAATAVDSNENANIRAVSINALAHSNSENAYNNPAVAEHLRKISSKTAPEALSKAAAYYLTNQSKAK
jgi:hypothetical protein